VLDRRDFLKAAPVAAAVVAETLKAAAPNLQIEAFDYQGVRLGASRWSDQAKIARELYLGLPDDDILQGFRAEAGLHAPGKPLGGWCAKDSSMVLGQWLSGMSRTYRATGDTAFSHRRMSLNGDGEAVGEAGAFLFCVMKEEAIVGAVGMWETRERFPRAVGGGGKPARSAHRLRWRFSTDVHGPAFPQRSGARKFVSIKR